MNRKQRKPLTTQWFNLMAWLDTETPTMIGAVDEEVLRGIQHLRRVDPVMASLIDAYGLYKFETTSSYFEIMLGTVVSQQLSTRASETIYSRMLEILGRKHPRPQDVLDTPEEAMREAGLSRSKAAYIRNVAEWFVSGSRGPGTFARMGDKEIMDALVSIRGIGEWSAHMFLMFALNRLDVFPVGDLGLRNAMAIQYRLRKDAPLKRYTTIAEKWAPYRTVASIYLWKSYDG